MRSYFKVCVDLDNFLSPIFLSFLPAYNSIALKQIFILKALLHCLVAYCSVTWGMSPHEPLNVAPPPQPAGKSRLNTGSPTQQFRLCRSDEIKTDKLTFHIENPMLHRWQYV